eukprot:5771672-Prymnesium_polylepis.1
MEVYACMVHMVHVRKRNMHALWCGRRHAGRRGAWWDLADRGQGRGAGESERSLRDCDAESADIKTGCVL